MKVYGEDYRNKKGIIVDDWAPYVEILSHGPVSAFFEALWLKLGVGIIDSWCTDS